LRHIRRTITFPGNRLHKNLRARATYSHNMAQPARRHIKRYGWIPDLPDRRDRIFSARAATLGALPPRVDLRADAPPIYDQGHLGSCTAQAIAAALQFDQAKQKQSDVFTPSRLFIYYNERVIEGSVDEDTGAMLRDGIKAVAKQGGPHERLWPHLISRFRRKPSPAAYRDGARHDAILYQRLRQSLDQLKGCLADGYPFVFGFSVYESFERPDVARTGAVPLPARGEALLGGHAVLAVGYDEAARRMIVRNSWGTAWGMRGYFTMPYEYLLDSGLSDDFWTIKLVE
jgi:C1A family cysteine protease